MNEAGGGLNFHFGMSVQPERAYNTKNSGLENGLPPNFGSQRTDFYPI